MSLILGIAVCAVAVGLMALRGGTPAMLFDQNALFLIIIGMIGATFIICPFSFLKDIFSVIIQTLKPVKKTDKLVSDILELTQTARREGILALEGREKNVENHILKKGLTLISGSADAATVRNILEKESSVVGEKEKAAQELFERLAVFSPGIGMVGTLIEIVQMLYRFKGPSDLAPGIAKALLPVVYGAVCSYLILFPLAARIKAGADRQRDVRELAIEGVLSIEAGEPPHLVEERLEAFMTGRRIKS